jgi:indolepyruvate ferredoxin oxidoreductase beta subunit
MNGTGTISMVGVGGQGILLAAAVLANTVMADGYDVKVSEVKGMAQRGGSVLSTVRYGTVVWSPVSPHSDLVIATELLEGRRALGMLPSGGALVAATTVIAPASVLRGEQAYPLDIEQAAAAAKVRLLLVAAEELAREAGSLRAANIVLLGAASAMLPFKTESWQRGLEAAVPAKILALNLHAFELGRDAGDSHRQEVAQ